MKGERVCAVIFGLAVLAIPIVVATVLIATTWEAIT